MTLSIFQSWLKATYFYLFLIEIIFLLIEKQHLAFVVQVNDMNSVQSYIAERPRSQAEIMSVLRSMILDIGPHVQEKISYTVPYFYFRGPLCYLSPKFDGAYIAFVRGNQLSNEHGLLESKERKYVRSIHFYSLAELEEKEDDIRAILNEAALLNEYYFQQKKSKKLASVKVRTRK